MRVESPYYVVTSFLCESGLLVFQCPYIQMIQGCTCWQVLAAVIKAGASREHEMLAEIQGAVFAFIRKMEPRRVMDSMLVSRVRILYIRSLLSRAPELQSLKV